MKIVVKVKEIGKRGRPRKLIMDYWYFFKLMKKAEPILNNPDKPITGKYRLGNKIYQI